MTTTPPDAYKHERHRKLNAGPSEHPGHLPSHCELWAPFVYARQSMRVEDLPIGAGDAQRWTIAFIM